MQAPLPAPRCPPPPQGRCACSRHAQRSGRCLTPSAHDEAWPPAGRHRHASKRVDISCRAVHVASSSQAVCTAINCSLHCEGGLRACRAYRCCLAWCVITVQQLLTFLGGGGLYCRFMSQFDSSRKLTTSG
jgi:hypothetical protein